MTAKIAVNPNETHNYHYETTDLGSSKYKIQWFDSQLLLCETETQIKGQTEDVKVALSLAAEQLRIDNAALFPEEVPEISLEDMYVQQD